MGSAKFAMEMVPRIRTAVTFEAVDREVVELLEEDNQAEVDTTMEVRINLQEATIKHTTRVSRQPAGSATSLDIAKKIAARESGKVNLVLDSTGLPIGPNQSNHQLMKRNKKGERVKPKVQLGKCTLATWPMFFRVFNEGHS